MFLFVEVVNRLVEMEFFSLSFYSMVLSHSILDNRLLKMNIDKETSQEKDGQAIGLITTNQRLTEWHQLQEKTKKKKNKCHGNRTEQQRRRRLRKREQRQQQQQLEPMDQDDPSQDEQIQVNCLLLFIESILTTIVSYNLDITHR